jgi:hypothetical protein
LLIDVVLHHSIQQPDEIWAGTTRQPSGLTLNQFLTTRCRTRALLGELQKKNKVKGKPSNSTRRFADPQEYILKLRGGDQQGARGRLF